MTLDLTSMPSDLTRNDVHDIISLRMKNSRPVAWEDDISRNTLDDAPFENNPAPAAREVEGFGNPDMLARVKPWLGDRNMEDLIKQDTCEIPIPVDREGYFPDSDAGYWLSGLEDYLKIEDAVQRHGVQPETYFDLGCASGRVIRHFAAQTQLREIWGSDINRRHIRWLLEYMPDNVIPIFNHAIPTLPMPDRSIDVVSAFSVFTHIDTFETHWLAEIRRVLADDGLCYLTVHNEDTWAELATQIDNPDNRLVQSMLRVDPTVADALKQPLPKSRIVYRFTQAGPYRAQVFHSNEYLRKVWGRFFKIEEILPLHHQRQTVLILRKR